MIPFPMLYIIYYTTTKIHNIRLFNVKYISQHSPPANKNIDTTNIKFKPHSNA